MKMNKLEEKELINDYSFLKKHWKMIVSYTSAVFVVAGLYFNINVMKMNQEAMMKDVSRIKIALIKEGIITDYEKVTTSHQVTDSYNPETEEAKRRRTCIKNNKVFHMVNDVIALKPEDLVELFKEEIDE